MFRYWAGILWCLNSAIGFSAGQDVNYRSIACPRVAPGLHWKNPQGSSGYRLVGAKSFRQQPTFDRQGRLQVVVEIPAGCNDKWEVNSAGELEWDRIGGKPRFIRFLPYPGNYGMIPNTRLDKKHGGDGDPLDVIVLGPAEPRGAVVPVRLVGVIRAKDGGETDDKLVAVSLNASPANAFAGVTTLAELKKTGVIALVRDWFMRYKGPGEMVINGLGGADEARKILEKAAIRASH